LSGGSGQSATFHTEIVTEASTGSPTRVGRRRDGEIEAQVIPNDHRRLVDRGSGKHRDRNRIAAQRVALLAAEKGN